LAPQEGGIGWLDECVLITGTLRRGGRPCADDHPEDSPCLR